MTFDEYGALLLSDPWIAATAIVAVLATVLWSHGWIASGAPPRPRTMAVRLRQDSANGAARHHHAFHASQPPLARRGSGAVIRLERQRRPRTAA